MMPKRPSLFLLCGLLWLACAIVAHSDEVGRGDVRPTSATLNPARSSESDPNYQRIISLSPAVTEVLFALGLGERVVGITRFCNYPPETEKIPRVGGYLDPSYEGMVGLDPDLIILLPYQRTMNERLEELGLNCITVNQENLDSILMSIRSIGEACGVADEAARLVAKIRRRIAYLQEVTGDQPHPEVMISLGRDYGSSSLDEVFIAGRHSYLSDLLEKVGGINVWKDESIPYPALSPEGILQLDPQVILEVVPSLGQSGFERQRIVAGWQALGDLQAVRNGRVYVIGGDFIAIPGPRLLLTLDAMAGALYPDLDLPYDE